jgi:2-methylcitrate dehydratase PrpD
MVSLWSRMAWNGNAWNGASAAASAKALGLDEARTAHALAIAASGASGIRENFGTMVKSLHAGQASAAGHWPLSWPRGFEGSLTAFEGKCGFWKVYSGENEIGRWVEELNEPHSLLGVMVKRYPSCAATHPALDALEDLMTAHPFPWKDVKELRCLVPPINLSVLIYPRPCNGLEAKFSLPYCVSAFLVHGKLDLSHFEKEALNDQRVRQLMEKVKVVPDDSLEELIKTKDVLAPTEVQVKLKNQTFSKRILEAKGGLSSPLPNAEIVGKFRVCAGRILSAERVSEAISMISSLESVRHITTLMEALHP